MHMINP